MMSVSPDCNTPGNNSWLTSFVNVFFTSAMLIHVAIGVDISHDQQLSICKYYECRNF